MESFAIKELTFAYPEEEEKVLDGISFSIKNGEFVTLVGSSGSGKTTLLRHLKSVLVPHGQSTGEILFEGKPLNEVGQYEQSAQIGFVMQSPENQIVTDKVWHELAFGLESLGIDNQTIRERVAEMASFFGIQNWFYKNVTELSGGQKQIMNLAAIMAMQPSVLILDEPTSQLDPIAASDFLATVGKINRELGTTVIITEHRLEEVLPLSDRLLVLDKGQLVCDDCPREVGRQLQGMEHSMFLSMPVPMQIFAAVPNDLVCPLSVREGREWLNHFADMNSLSLPEYDYEEKKADQELMLSVDEVWFKYERNLPDVVKGLSAKLYKGEFFAILGGNGTGKSTSLSLLAGLNKPYRGSITIQGEDIHKTEGNLYHGMIGVLPQNPQNLFVKKTVGEDLWEAIRDMPGSKVEKEDAIRRVSGICRLNDLKNRHPYDLSGGEQQRAALAKVLLLEPRILILDEPTKGLDADFKGALADILRNLLRQGVTVIMASHDIEFCAKYTDRCALFFDGRIVSVKNAHDFFCGNNFYTTSANRMARHLIQDAVVADDVILACGGKVAPTAKITEEIFVKEEKKDVDDYRRGKSKVKKPSRLSLWRKIVAAVAGIATLVSLVYAVRVLDVNSSFSEYIKLYMVLVTSLVTLGVSVAGRSKPSLAVQQTSQEERHIPKRTMLATFMILLAIPLTIYIGDYYLASRKYYFISLLIILETMLPFMLLFEKRKPQARELVIISVLCALGVAGRMAFFMLPQFKPVAAIVILAGVAFGGEAGFLVGAVTMLTSNVLLGQGPWSPWQMFAMGIIGFLAGVLFRKGLLRRNKESLCVFGGLATLIVYGGLMNPAHVIMITSEPTWPMFLSAYIMGLPFDVIHATATITFLWFISQPMLEKLDRIKIKYGLIG